MIITGLQSLRELKVNQNNITTLTSLKALPCLVELHVSHNKLKSLNGIQQIPTLQVVWAESNLITTVKVPQTYAHHQKLKDAQPSAAASSIKRINSAATDRASLSSRGIDAIGESASIVGMQKLSEIYLSNNKIDNLNGIDRLGIALKVFDVSKNNIALLSDESVVDFVTSLSHLKNLSQLFLYGNPISSNEAVMQNVISKLISNLGDKLESIDNIILHNFNKTEDEKRSDLLNDKSDGIDDDPIDDVSKKKGAKTKEKNNDDNDEDENDYENEDFENTTKRNMHRNAPKLSLKNLYTLEEIEFMEKEFRSLVAESREKMTTIFNLPINKPTDEIEFVDKDALRVDRDLNRTSVTLKGILKKNNEDDASLRGESESHRASANNLKVSNGIIRSVLKKVYVSEAYNSSHVDTLTEDRLRKLPFITADIDYKMSSSNLGDDSDNVSTGGQSTRSAVDSEYTSASIGETFLIEKMTDKSSHSTKKNKAIYRNSNSVVASINSLGSGLTRHGSKIVTRSIFAPSSARVHSADDSDTRSEGENMSTASSHATVFANNPLDLSSILDPHSNDSNRPLSRIVVLPKYFDTEGDDDVDHAKDTSRSSSSSLPSARSESQIEPHNNNNSDTINGNSFKDRKRAFSGPNLHVMGSVSIGYDARSNSNNNNNNKEDSKDEVIAKIAKLLRRTNSEPSKVTLSDNDYNLSINDSDGEDDPDHSNRGNNNNIDEGGNGDEEEEEDIKHYSPRYLAPALTTVIVARPSPGKSVAVLAKSPAPFAALNKKGFLEWRVPNIKEHK